MKHHQKFIHAILLIDFINEESTEKMSVQNKTHHHHHHFNITLERANKANRKYREKTKGEQMRRDCEKWCTEDGKSYIKAIFYVDGRKYER